MENMKVFKERFGIDSIIYIFLIMLPIIWCTNKSVQLVIVMIMVGICLLMIRTSVFNKFLVSLGIYIVSYVCSVVINMFKCKEISRLFAAFNSVAIWIAAALLFSIVLSIKVDKNIIYRIYFYLMIFEITISLFVIVLSAIGINEYSLLGRDLIGTEWYDGKVRIRSGLCMEYAALVSESCFCIIPFAYEYIKEKKLLTKLSFLLLCFTPLYVSNSRLGIVLVSMVIFYEIYIALKSNNNTKWIIAILGIVCILLGLMNINIFIYYFHKLLYGRSASNTTRLLLYKETFNKFLDSTWLLGAGIKIYIPEIPNIPIGSHSTYLGALYKTGVIGALGLIIFLFMVLRFLYINGKRKIISGTYFVSYLGLSLMCILEDLDGADWMLIFYMVSISIIMNIVKMEKSKLLKQ